MTLPWNSIGATISTVMTGSRTTGLALLKASRKAPIAARRKASSFESTAWAEPSSRTNLQPVIGWPVIRPLSSASWKPYDYISTGRYHFTLMTLIAAAHLLNSRDELVGNVTTDNPVLKGSILASVGIDLHGLDGSNDPTELTRTTRLFFVGVIEFGGFGDGFSESNTGFTRDTGNIVFPLHTFNINVEV